MNREYMIRWNDEYGEFDLTLFGKHVVSTSDIETLITFSCYSPVRISL